MKFPLILATAACLVLSGCAQVLTATTEEPIKEDPTRRTTGALIDDELVEIKALVNLAKASPSLENAHISAVSFNGIMLLVGQVPDAQSRKLAEQVVSKLHKIRTVHNELEVAGPTSQLVRTNDTWLTGKIKTAMLADRGIEGSRLKVVTENGVVYLMGLTTQREAERAVNLARQTQGVQKVVKIFEYIR
ncbi:BON domain-containing protein [Motiliproteus sp. SC1-56]|uniref:BON domain-containing protein n=1 Tax=Motiliproteus sp. SC1-56 TaxID=2799565 RepID=UPI001A8D5610|nr:BON domain-containing protein [Motiliproteus sp. SC1-56]